MLTPTPSCCARTKGSTYSAEKMIESKRSIFANALRKHFPFRIRCWHSMRECSHAAIASDPKMVLKGGLLSFNVLIFREITPPYLNGDCCPKFNPIYKAAYNSQQLPHPSSAFFMAYIFCCSFSYSEMLKQCAKRACYNTLQKHDLLTPLPFKDNQFDCLLSVAVTTYLSKNLESFLIFGNHVGLVRTYHKYICTYAAISKRPFHLKKLLKWHN